MQSNEIFVGFFVDYLHFLALIERRECDMVDYDVSKQSEAYTRK